MNNAIFFENAGDERGTPQKFFDELNAEFHFDLDAAADELNHKCELYYGKGGIAYDALEEDWAGMTVYLNPPYSVAGAFIAKAREEADKGATVVMLLPVRSDTRWWHRHIWDKNALRVSNTAYFEREGGPLVPVSPPRDGDWHRGVRCRLIPGRLTFELKVPAELRVWIKAEYQSQVLAIEAASKEREHAVTEYFRSLVAVTGLPRMAISRILEDFPDDDLLEGAPFPSCVVIFTKAS